MWNSSLVWRISSLAPSFHRMLDSHQHAIVIFDLMLTRRLLMVALVHVSAFQCVIADELRLYNGKYAQVWNDHYMYS